MNTTDFTPIPVIEVDAADLADPGWSADRLTPNQQGQVCLRVRHHGWPLAQQVETGLASGDDAVARVRAIVIEHQGVVPDGWPHRYPTAQQLVSVVVCTLGREPRLRATITSLLEQSHARLEVIVVDNDPATGRTANLLGHLTDRRLRIVPEPRRGLSVARNTGLAAARAA
ncbi:glycosyltransferase family A protein [Nocardioides alcanivorans]|uniref:glycosyltransferase family A protein n=1 Tax=Nocardioides alcanivorans TaxID=2897352 RepID=UPI0024B1D5A0|nr:glycosyltransferase family A protein [Nocardioides alcanivorans]